jgi:chromosome segregation ATPase
MNLNKLINTYKDVRTLEKEYSQIDKTTDFNLREKEKLETQLKTLNIELGNLDEECCVSENQLQIETRRLAKLTADLDQSQVTPRTLTQLERQFLKLETKTHTIEDKILQLENLFETLTEQMEDPELQRIFQHMPRLENQLKQLTGSQKKLRLRKAKLDKGKITLTAGVTTVSGDIEQLDKKYRQDIDCFTKYRENAPNLEKKKGALNKQSDTLTKTIKALKNKLRKEASAEVIQQYQEDLEDCKAELEREKRERTAAESKKQEMTKQVQQESQRLENTRQEIEELRSITAETASFLATKSMDLPAMEENENPGMDNTIEIILYLKKYFRETLNAQVERTGKNNR